MAVCFVSHLQANTCIIGWAGIFRWGRAFWTFSRSKCLGTSHIWNYMGDEHTPLVFPREGRDTSLIPAPLFQGNIHPGIGPIVQNETGRCWADSSHQSILLAIWWKNNTGEHKISWETPVTKYGCIKIKACNLGVCPKQILNGNHMSPLMDLIVRWSSWLYPLVQGTQSPLVRSRPFSSLVDLFILFSPYSAAHSPPHLGAHQVIVFHVHLLFCVCLLKCVLFDVYEL